MNIVKYLPEEIISIIYSYMIENVKFTLSKFSYIFKKYIFNYKDSNNKSFNPIIYAGYQYYNYCTYDKTALLLKDMLFKIPIDKLQKYLYHGTPSKYFNIAFPDEPNMKEYIKKSYSSYDITIKNNKEIQNMYKDYVFEIIDLISYFSTKANKWHISRCINNFNNYNIHKNIYFSQLQFTYCDNLNNKSCIDESEDYCILHENITNKLILSVLYVYNKYGK